MDHNKKDERVENKGPGHRADCPAADCKKPEDAADHAVKKVFGILGVDVDNPKEVEQFRKGLRFGEAMHKYANKGMMTVVVVMSTAVVLATLAGMAYKISCLIPPGQGGK
jgi:hypothetical protein